MGMGLTSWPDGCRVWVMIGCASTSHVLAFALWLAFRDMRRTHTCPAK